MRIPLVIALGAICTASLSAEILFQGYMTSAEKTLFVLSVEKARTSGWLAVGQAFEGYSIVAFEPKAELLTVEKDGKRQAIHIVDGKVQAAGEATTQAATRPITISIGDNETVFIGDDLIMLDALKKKLELVAAMVPQPIIALRAPPNTRFERVRAILDLCRASGIKRLSMNAE